MEFSSFLAPERIESTRPALLILLSRNTKRARRIARVAFSSPALRMRWRAARYIIQKSRNPMTPSDRAKQELKNLEAVAGNGLLHRRAFIHGGAALAGAITGYTLVPSAFGQQLADDAWSLVPGVTVPDYG